ncbi:MAG: LapA family protein [Bacteroidetes bacterium]|nr:LapA family protein [Bacteroidota bacterium]
MRQLIIAIVIALMAIVFALQNADPVTVELFFWNLPNTSLALLLVITLIIGIISGLLFMASSVYSKNQIVSAQKKRILELEKQITLKK